MAGDSRDSPICQQIHDCIMDALLVVHGEVVVEYLLGKFAINIARVNAHYAWLRPTERADRPAH
jgi:hypothetical protein